MDEYIKKEDALEIVRRTSGDYAAAFSEIGKLPAEDVAPVRRGRWIPEFPLLGNNSLFFKCSVCGFETTGGKQYCTRCFTKMDLEDEDHG